MEDNYVNGAGYSDEPIANPPMREVKMSDIGHMYDPWSPGKCQDGACALEVVITDDEIRVSSIDMNETTSYPVFHSMEDLIEYIEGEKDQ